MRAGQLRDRITIEVPPSILTDAGEVDDSGGWLEVTTRWAEVRPLRGRELEQAQQIFAEATIAITIRYVQGVLPYMRVRLPDDRLLNIVSVLDIENRHIQLDLLCREGGVVAVGADGVGTGGASFLRRDEFDADGSTNVFELANTPFGEVAWFRNGMIQSDPGDYTRSGTTITQVFPTPASQLAGDKFTAVY